MTGSPASNVTVVVPSYGRPDSLGRTLRSLELQTRSPASILVVARGSDHETASTVRRHPETVLVTVDLPGLAAAMHRGLDAARTPVVAFTDDDAEPASDWCDRIETAFAASSRLGALGGRDDVVGDDDPPIDSAKVGRFTWYGRFLGYHHRGTGVARSVAHLKGVNLSIRKQLVTGVDLTGWVRGPGGQYGNELFLCLRVRSRGYDVRYDPSLRVVHHAEARVDGTTRAASQDAQVRNDTYNQVMAVRRNLGAIPTARAAVFACLVGEKSRPGVVRAVRWEVRSRTHGPRGRVSLGAIRANLGGVMDALTTPL